MSQFLERRCCRVSMPPDIVIATAIWTSFFFSIFFFFFFSFFTFRPGLTLTGSPCKNDGLSGGSGHYDETLTGGVVVLCAPQVPSDQRTLPSWPRSDVDSEF